MLYVSMFAYVRFIDDNIRQILPLDHIKDFCPQDVKDFEIKKKISYFVEEITRGPGTILQSTDIKIGW